MPVLVYYTSSNLCIFRESNCLIRVTMAQVEGVFEAPLQEAIQASKILVVGAGGIGCELLKNIVLCGKLIFNSPVIQSLVCFW